MNEFHDIPLICFLYHLIPLPILFHFLRIPFPSNASSVSNEFAGEMTDKKKVAVKRLRLMEDCTEISDQFIKELEVLSRSTLFTPIYSLLQWSGNTLYGVLLSEGYCKL